MQGAFCIVQNLYSVFVLCVTIHTMVFFLFLFFLRKPEPLDVLVPYDNHSSLLEFLVPFPLSWLVENEGCGGSGEHMNLEK